MTTPVLSVTPGLPVQQDALAWAYLAGVALLFTLLALALVQHASRAVHPSAAAAVAAPAEVPPAEVGWLQIGP